MKKAVDESNHSPLTTEATILLKQFAAEIVLLVDSSLI